MELTVASERTSAFERAQPANLLTLDFATPERAADQARQFAREHPVGGVVGVDDDTAVVAAHIARTLDLAGNSVEAALAARDKQRQRVALAAAGVPAPRAALHHLDENPGTLAAQVAYPCVLKPLRLAASQGVIRADEPGGFTAAVARLAKILAVPAAAGCGDVARQFLVEEFVPGPEVALEGLLVAGRLQVLALFDKPDPLDGPFFEETIYVTPSRLPLPEQGAVREVAQDAVRALGLRDGPVHAELRVNDRGAWLIELAARPIGGRCSAALRFVMREAGGGKREASLEEIILCHAMGMKLPTLEREPRASGVMMIPVPGGGALREVLGLEEARAVPLVEEIAITAHRGQMLVPWPEGSRYPGFIFARGETPAAVEAALRAAHGRLRFVLESAHA